MRNQLKIISGFAALTASVAGVCLEAVYTPPSPQKWALVFGISAVAGLRLYLYSEGSALVEISPKDARRAFTLSVILSLALIAYGFLIKFARGEGAGEFPAYAFFLFLLLQTAIPFTEWVFSRRLGASSRFFVNRLQSKRKDALEAALWYRKKYRSALDRLTDIQATQSARINTLSSENAAQAARLSRLEALERAKVPSPKKVMGAPVAICPECYRAGRLEVVSGGPNSKTLTCNHNHSIQIK
jgi:hypothetical protein